MDNNIDQRLAEVLGEAPHTVTAGPPHDRALDSFRMILRAERDGSLMLKLADDWLKEQCEQRQEEGSAGPLHLGVISAEHELEMLTHELLYHAHATAHGTVSPDMAVSQAVGATIRLIKVLATLRTAQEVEHRSHSPELVEEFLKKGAS